MKPMRFLVPAARKRSRRGFSLVEAVLSLGIMSFGFLAMAPLMVVGLNGSRAAQENRAMAQLAATCIEQAKQGTLASGTSYLDSTSNPCSASQAAYTVQSGFSTCDANGATPGAPLTRLTLRIIPRNLPNAVRIYTDVYPTPAP